MAVKGYLGEKWENEGEVQQSWDDFGSSGRNANTVDSNINLFADGPFK